MDLFNAFCTGVGSVVSVWRPTRAANATAGRNDPAWSLHTSFTAIIEQHDTERRMAYGGELDSRNATLYCSATSGLLLRVGDIVTVGADTWKVEGAPVQPSAGGHYEVFLGEVTHRPEDVA